MRSEGYSTWIVHVHLSVCLSVRLSVCLSVCLCVDAYSGTTGYESAYELYKRVQIYEGLKGDSLETTAFGRYGMKTSEKGHYANDYSLTAALLQRPLARCVSMTEASKGVLNGKRQVTRYLKHR